MLAEIKYWKLGGKNCYFKKTEMKKIDGNNLIVDHSRDPEENKGSHCWQKKTELLFVMRLNHQLNNKLEISDIFIYISLKIRVKIVIKSIL